MEQTQLPPRTTSKPKLKPRRIWLKVGLSIVLILALVITYYLYSIYSFANEIYESPPAPIASAEGGDGEPLPAISEPPEWYGDERINILLLGGDSRGIKSTSYARSDTMMVVSIDPADKSTHLFSLLRDTYVKIPGKGSNRINSAITSDGPLLSMETVSNLMDIPIHYYVYTDFEGFISLIDAIGGVEFEVDKNMRRVDNADDPRYNIKLEKGLQQMDGLTALQYVRYRSDALSDFSRADRQRKFLSAIANKMKSTTSLFKLPLVLNSIAPYIKTDIPPGDLLKLAKLGLKLDTTQLTGIQIPPSGSYKDEVINGMEVLVIVPENIQSYVKEQLAL
jgi:LCP family protein required for cell wall assembly